MDELAFEVGELIDVIEYEDPEEQVRDQQNKIQYSFSSIIFSGRGMADGCQRINRTEGSFPSQFHKAYLNCLIPNCSLYEARILCLANYF